MDDPAPKSNVDLQPLSYATPSDTRGRPGPAVVLALVALPLGLLGVYLVVLCAIGMVTTILGRGGDLDYGDHVPVACSAICGPVFVFISIRWFGDVRRIATGRRQVGDRRI